MKLGTNSVLNCIKNTNLQGFSNFGCLIAYCIESWYSDYMFIFSYPLVPSFIEIHQFINVFEILVCHIGSATLNFVILIEEK